MEGVRAFVKEDVDLPERSGRKRSASGLPPGATNYITARGAKRLRDELQKLRVANAVSERVADSNKFWHRRHRDDSDNRGARLRRHPRKANVANCLSRRGCRHLLGFTATLVKETVAQLGAHGLIGAIATWQTYAAIGFGLAGVLIMQWALHTGPLLASQPGFTLMDPIVSVLWGVLVYNEQTRTGAWLILAVLGMATLAGGVLMLARSPLLNDVRDCEDVPVDPAGSRYLRQPGGLAGSSPAPAEIISRHAGTTSRHPARDS